MVNEVNPYLRYHGNGEYSIDIAAMANEGRDKRTVHLGTKGWLMNSTNLYGNLPTKEPHP